MAISLRFFLLSVYCCSLLMQVVVVTRPAADAAASSPVLTTFLKTFNPSLTALLNNVTTSYPRSAYASPYVIWSPTGFPVALGDDTSPLPVVAAVELPTSGGRIVAFGHEGIPGSCCSNNDNWDKLTVNAVRWLSNSKKIVRMASFGASWATSAMAGVRQQAIKGLTVKASIVDLNTFVSGGSSNIDVYWIDTYTDYTPAQVEALIKFANQTGKGLLVGGHAWYWAYSHVNANIYVDLAINRVLWPLGLAVTTGLQIGFQPPPISPPANWAYYNSYVATGLLAEAKTNAGLQISKSVYPTVNAALNLLLNSLPPRAASVTSGLVVVWSRLQAARTTSGTGIGPSSPLTVKDAYPGQLLDVAIEVWGIQRGDLTELKPSRSAAAYPGVPALNATKVNVTLTINGTYNRPPFHFWSASWDEPVWRSTGLYAPPGQLITVTVTTPSIIGKGLKVQVGAHTDDLSSKDVWYRLPVAVSRFDLNATVTFAGNPLGGLVYILVPVGANLNDVQVTISGAVRAPYFRLATTRMSEWISTIRNHPGPWAELDSGKFVIMVPSTAIRALSNPVPLLTHWNLVMDSMAYLANIPTNRARSERFLVDADIGGGWMHSGYPIMAYDDPEVHKEVLDVIQLKTTGAWGPYHELGHNHQWGEAQFKGTGESYNNVWTAYALNKTGVPPSASANANALTTDGRAAIRSEYFLNGANWDRDWDVWVALDTYLQLRDGFGWDFYRNINAAYQQMIYPLQDDEVQTWIQTSSAVTGFNLVPFYMKWGFPITDATMIMTAKLPTWAANPFVLQQS